MRKVCVVVASRANYGRIKSALQAIKEHPKLELQLIVGASALLYRFGEVVEIIKRDGFRPDATLHMVIEGDTPATMAKSTGLGVIEMTTVFETLQPDVVITVADRYETLATAVSASYMNIPLAHTQGGEVTGSIDESVRHAITKLAHIHFPASQRAAENVIRMGEDPARVFMTGCPSMDLLSEIDLTLPADFFHRSSGVGPSLDEAAPYLVVLQHPVTTEYGDAYRQIEETLKAVQRTGMQVAWLWPNVDAGSDQISKRLRIFRERNPGAQIHFFKNFSAEDYARLINNCACLVGNSSSGIREGAFLGIPAVNIGNRQRGREHGVNVVNVGYGSDAIFAAIQAQIAHGRYERSPIFGTGRAGAQIADILATIDLSIQKQLHY
ncbi:MAG: UDP-N-acetylglucosamine 2-epimerase [Ferrovibrio sp.]|jgi:UDP-hydrolysing UDP-N-acetyl-D-glucosamine 2-epimerase